eukprot:IDg7009t1
MRLSPILPTPSVSDSTVALSATGLAESSRAAFADEDAINPRGMKRGSSTTNDSSSLPVTPVVEQASSPGAKFIPSNRPDQKSAEVLDVDAVMSREVSSPGSTQRRTVGDLMFLLGIANVDLFDLPGRFRLI